jgi:hypothetical protein
MANATFIPHNSELKTKEVESLLDTFSLEELQEQVGGYIELVRMDHTLMVVNEEGMLLGLPLNHRASAAAGIIIRGNVLLGDEGMMK